MHCIKSAITIFRNSRNKIIPIRQEFKFDLSYKNIRCLSQSTRTLEDDSDQIINELCNGDQELEKKLRVFMLEVEVMRQDGRRAPTALQLRHWKHLMDLETRSQRTKYLLYLWKTEKSKENQKAKKEERRQDYYSNLPAETKEYPDDLEYGIKHQSLFLRIRDTSMNNADNYRALQAMTFGLPIVIDCSYEEHMVWREKLNAAKQMTFVFGDNRIHKDPFNLHLCNVDKEGDFMQQLKRNIPTIDEPWFPMNIHEKSYMEVFPKEKLVYLTPHCRNELTEYDPDAVYIIGCMVDKVNNDHLSLAKAKRDGIKMAKLPLDRYLEWGPGGSKKCLNINHMVPILLDLKLTRDWEHALRHVPRRKLMESKMMQMQRKIKNPGFKEQVMKSYNQQHIFNKLTFKQKRQQSKKSLYYDEE